MDGGVEFTVRDFGKGVPEQDIHKLFIATELTSNRLNGSAHVGLPSSQLLAFEIGGEISYRVGKRIAPDEPGTEFTLFVPDLSK